MNLIDNFTLTNNTKIEVFINDSTILAHENEDNSFYFIVTVLANDRTVKFTIGTMAQNTSYLYQKIVVETKYKFGYYNVYVDKKTAWKTAQEINEAYNLYEESRKLIRRH